MTGDARGEAERIVYQACASEDTDRLVAALAAAIEEDDAEQCLGRVYSRPGAATDGEIFDANHRLSAAREARCEALSALRARAGEEDDGR